MASKNYDSDYGRERKKGDLGLEAYLHEVKKTSPFTSEEEFQSYLRIKKGDIDSRNKLVEANLRFVISVAKEYQNQGLPLSDLISAGNEGLITAANRFDGTRGFKFISYAVWWVRQSIHLALANDTRVVRIPNNQIDVASYLNKIRVSLMEELGREPTLYEIADEVEMSPEKVLHTISSVRKPVSLDAALYEDDEKSSSLIGAIPDKSTESPDYDLLKKDMKEKILSSLETLPEREAQILKLHFGVNGEEPLNLEQIGHRYQLTRERVRQLRDRALERLRKREGKNLEIYNE